MIGREEVIAGLEKVWNAFNCMEHELYADYVYDALALLKAKPVKRGRWIMGDTAEAYDIQGVKTWAVKAKCSECGLVCRFIEAHGIYEFCPRCGAKMEQKDEL